MKRTDVDSSHVRSIGYADGTLEVEYKGGAVYRFDDVPAETGQSALAAAAKGDSIGTFLNTRIKPYHTYKRIY